MHNYCNAKQYTYNFFLIINFISIATRAFAKAKQSILCLMKYSMRSACAQHFSRVVGPLAQVAVADASEFLIRHNRNELRAACGALSLVESGSEHELLDRLLSAARDVASTSLTMQHSKSISDDERS